MPRVTRKKTDQYALKQHMFKVNEKGFCDGAVFIRALLSFLEMALSCPSL